MNISGNEQDGKLAKLGCTLEHKDALATHEHAHPTPYHLKKIGGPQCKTHQIKAPFDTLENTSLNMTKAQSSNYGIPNTPITQMARQQRHRQTILK